MTQQLQFSCPACRNTLVVPIAAAGAQGPCPRCSVEIIGPDPARGQAAQVAEFVAPWAEQSAPGTPPPERQAPQAQAPKPTPPEPQAPETRTPEPTPQPEPQAPAPSQAVATDEAVLPRSADAPSRGISGAVLVLSCLLVAALAGGGGYWFGLNQSTGAPENPPLAGDKPPPLSAAVPLKTWLPTDGKPVSASPDGTPKATGPTSVLRAFLSAPGWAARSAHVLPGKEVHQQMAVQASIYGDGPIASTEIALLQEGEDSHVFLVKTEKIPSGFPVALARADDGWLVDWQTFSEFFYDRFNTFAAEPSEAPETFHLLVNHGGPGADEDIATFRLNPPMPGREKLAKVRKDSTAYSALGQVFKQQQELDPETFSELTRSQGLPLVVVLSSRGNGSGGASLWIDDVIAVGWGPR